MFVKTDSGQAKQIKKPADFRAELPWRMTDKFARTHLAQQAKTDENVHEAAQLAGKHATGSRQGLGAALPPASRGEVAIHTKKVPLDNHVAPLTLKACT